MQCVLPKQNKGLVVADPLRNLDVTTRAQMHALGDEFIHALTHLVNDNEEFVVEWFADRWRDEDPDEIYDWSIARVARFTTSIVLVELELILTTLFETELDDEGELARIGYVGVRAFGRVRLGAPAAADDFDLECADLGAYIARYVT